ncbi:MAG: DUF1016 N-terminal domain-containing protein [Bacteroidota bacterium]
MEKSKLVPSNEDGLFAEVRTIIIDTRTATVKAVNSNLVLMNWKIGELIHKFVLEGERAAYGQRIIAQLSKKLVVEFGKGYSKANLFHCLRIAETFPDFQIVYALSRQLSWTHFRSLIYIKEPLKREFYTILCLREGWNTRVLSGKIQSMLFERTAISKKPGKLIVEKSKEKIELLQLDNGRIRVAEYLTSLPPREILEQKLQKAIELANERVSVEKSDH